MDNVIEKTATQSPAIEMPRFDEATTREIARLEQFEAEQRAAVQKRVEVAVHQWTPARRATQLSTERDLALRAELKRNGFNVDDNILRCGETAGGELVMAVSVPTYAARAFMKDGQSITVADVGWLETTIAWAPLAEAAAIEAKTREEMKRRRAELEKLAAEQAERERQRQEQEAAERERRERQQAFDLERQELALEKCRLPLCAVGTVMRRELDAAKQENAQALKNAEGSATLYQQLEREQRTLALFEQLVQALEHAGREAP
jgi:hypothetical protein